MHLKTYHKEDQLWVGRNISSMKDLHYEPETAKRAGDAILTTKKHVDGHYPFTVLPDDDIVKRQAMYFTV